MTDSNELETNESRSLVGWLNQRGTINLIAEVLGLTGVVSLVLAWVLPWGYWLDGSTPTDKSLFWLLFLLAIGYLLAAALAGPAMVVAAPWRRWIQRIPTGRAELFVPSSMIVPAVWGDGCAIWGISILSPQFVPDWGGFAVYFSSVLLSVSCLLFWLAQADFASRLRWLAPTVAVAVVIAVIVGQGIGWRSRYVVVHTTAAVSVLEPAPTSIAGVAWQRPLAEGEYAAGDIGGRVMIVSRQNVDGKCAGGVIALDPVNGQEAWRFINEIPCDETRIEVDGDTHVLRLHFNWPDSVYLDPATGVQLFPDDYPSSAGPYFVGDLAISWDSAASTDDLGTLLGFVPETGEMRFNRAFPRCSDGRAISTIGFPTRAWGDADVLDPLYPAMAVSTDTVALHLWCHDRETGLRARGLWIINLTDAALDRMLWLDQVPAGNKGDLSGNDDLHRPVIAGDVVITARDIPGPDDRFQTTVQAIDILTGVTRWELVGIPQQMPIPLGEHRMLLPAGLALEPSPSGGSGISVPVVLDTVTGEVAITWEPVDIDATYKVATIAVGKSYGTVKELGSEDQLLIRDLLTGNIISRSAIEVRCGGPYSSGDVGIVGSTYYCTVDTAPETRQLVGLR